MADAASRLAAWAGLIALGLAVQVASGSIADPEQWIPDVAVGIAFGGAGLLALQGRRDRGTAFLLLATGVTWFAGTLPVAASLVPLVHRGPLVHLLLAYVGWRARSRVDATAIAIGYLTALTGLGWGTPVASSILALGLVAVAVVGWARAAGPVRRDRRLAALAAAGVGCAIAAGAIARSVLGSAVVGGSDVIAYDVALVVVAIALYAGLRHPAGVAITDLVVQLDEADGGSSRGRLAQLLGDASVEIGYWSPPDASYVDGSGAAISLPPDGSRAAVRVDRDGAPFAVLVHDGSVVRSPELLDAVDAATTLVESNGRLRATVADQVAELAASRRRLLAAEDDARAQLEERLRAGPEQRLRMIATTLEGLSPADADTAAAVARAREGVRRTIDDAGALTHGLAPRSLQTGGLSPAIDRLAAGAGLPVIVRFECGRLPPSVETTVYFVCAEGLANITKHARAATAGIDVTQSDDSVTVVVRDDGTGGAAEGTGTGLRGLRDRVEAMGGTLAVERRSTGGSRLIATMPIASREVGDGAKDTATA